MEALPFNLILVSGAMRSGTTLLQRVLCSAPSANRFVQGARYLTAQVEIFANYAGSDRLYVKDYFGDDQGLFDFTADLLARHLREAHRRNGEPEHLVLKNPEMATMLPQTAALLPSARFVLSVREPKDTIASMIVVGEKHRKSGTPSFLARAGRDIGLLCQSYRRFYTPALQATAQESSSLGDRICLVSYESLIEDTGRTVARLSNFSGIPIAAEPALSQAARRDGSHGGSELADHPRWSAYVTELSGKPISSASIGRYRDVLNKNESAEIDRHCADLRRAFGYA